MCEFWSLNMSWHQSCNLTYVDHVSILESFICRFKACVTGVLPDRIESLERLRLVDRAEGDVSKLAAAVVAGEVATSLAGWGRSGRRGGAVWEIWQGWKWIERFRLSYICLKATAIVGRWYVYYSENIHVSRRFVLLHCILALFLQQVKFFMYVSSVQLLNSVSSDGQIFGKHPPNILCSLHFSTYNRWMIVD